MDVSFNLPRIAISHYKSSADRRWASPCMLPIEPELHIISLRRDIVTVGGGEEPRSWAFIFGSLLDENDIFEVRYIIAGDSCRAQDSIIELAIRAKFRYLILLLMITIITKIYHIDD